MSSESSLADLEGLKLAVEAYFVASIGLGYYDSRLEEILTSPLEVIRKAALERVQRQEAGPA